MRAALTLAGAGLACALLLLPGCQSESSDLTVSGAVAGTNSPAINFQNTQAIGAPYPEVTGMARMTDGSFTQFSFGLNTANDTITTGATVPNIQTVLIGGAGLAGRMRLPTGPNLDADPLGSASRNPVYVDLGNGIGSLVGYTEQVQPGQLLVQPANANITPKGAFTAYGGLGPSPSGVMVGDFNGDGKKDIAVLYTGGSNSLGGVSVLLGNGDGTLRPAANYGSIPNALYATAYDFNGDGRTDLAVASYTAGTISILLANADGSLRAGSTVNVGQSNFILSVAAADLNGDKRGDLLVLSNSTVYIFYGKGDGTFQNGPTMPVSVPYGAIGSGDFNQDGIADIAVTDGYGEVYILLGTGNGTYSAPTGYWVGTQAGQFYVEDYDGDGHPDLVFAGGHPDYLTPVAYDSQVWVLFGNGDGTFASATVTPIDGAFDSQNLPTGIVTADFNGDGKPDLATANPTSNSISVMLGKGSGAFRLPTNTSLGAVQPTSIAAGDFNGDGSQDLVVTDGVSNVDILLGKGDGTFQKPLVYPVIGKTPSAVVAGDFNGDKKLDLAVADSASGAVSLLLGNGDGTFKTAATFPVGSNPVSLFAADLNGDGKLDLAVANSGTFSTAGTNTGNISILLGKGDGTFQAAVNYAAYNYPVFVTVADVNGDQKPDLVVASRGANGSDQLAVLAGNGNGTFQPAVLTKTAPGPAWVSVADFNLDGNPDLLVAHCCNLTSLTVLQGNGDGTFQAETAFATGSFFSTAVADWNGDGKPDFAATDYVAEGWPHTVFTFTNISVTHGTLAITSAAGNPLKAPPVAPYSIVTAKGADLATGTANTAANPPITSAGTAVTILDSAGVSRPAQLFYVSPGQVNFLIPQATAPGNATITVTSGDGYVSVGTVAVAPVAPSIFTLNGNSLVAAYIQVVHADGTQTLGNLYAVDTSGNVTFPPISLGLPTDQVYLNIYGTGIQGRSSLGGVTITVGGVQVSALYAGPSTYPGEDQVAILLPRTLVGAGTVNLLLSADGNAANNVTLNVQ